MAGYVPPPGLYVTDFNLLYSGSASGEAAVGITLRQTGAIANIDADVRVDGTVYLNAPLALWVAPEKLLGGNVGFGVMVPIGRKEVDVSIDAFIEVVLPNGTVIDANRHFDFEDSMTNVGDPLLTAEIGWQKGNWYWSLAGLLNVPIGPWDTQSITNLSFHRWAFDLTGGLTWLDPKIGHEVSVAAGFTFNGENPATDYTTGTEFHVEWGLIHHFSKTFTFGLAGYHYQQVTGDSGPGARLGSFEGRVTALGPVLTYTFECGKIPISTELEWMHEFGAVNRAEGDVGLLTITMPLSTSTSSTSTKSTSSK